MRRFAVAAVVLLGVLAVAVPAVGAPVGSAQRLAACGSAKVGGATVITHCGPARVTFTFAGRTYQVSGGACSFDVGFWTLLVGRQTISGKPKFTSFEATFAGKPKARTYTKGFTLSLAFPGQSWALAAGLPYNVTVTAGGKKGTFKGSFFTGEVAGTKKASGSWSC
jgi:hypothetical protein